MDGYETEGGYQAERSRNNSAFDRDTGEILPERPQLPAMAQSSPQNLIFASANPGAIFGALCEMQGTMPSPKRTKKATVDGETASGKQYKYDYNYAPLEEIIAAVKEPMSKAGLAYRQFLASRDGAWVMRTVIAHQSGEWFGCDYPIFWNQKKGMQGFASGVTYARRYGLMLALGIAAEDDADANVADGNVATVQNARQGRSGGSGRTEAPKSTASTSQHTNGAQRPLNGGSADPAANGQGATSTDASPGPSSTGDAAARETGIAQWRNAAKAIDACNTIPEIDALFADEAGNETKQWFECKAIITKGDPAKAAGAIQQLVDRAEARKTLLMGGDLKEYEV